MSDSFDAIVMEAGADGKPVAGLKQLRLADLPDEDVLVEVSCSTVNYKDGLAVTNTIPICRKLPMVCGIDLAGTVVESRSPDWTAGDRVLVNGYGLSETYWGGYSRFQRLKPEWLVRVPEVFSCEEAMAIGTAGYTAMLCVNAIRDHGVVPASGPVLVTGAAGGVGSIAVMVLARLGYEVVGSTGRPWARDYLLGLGAKDTIDRAALARDPKPLEKETWAACVDSVGSTTLATAISQTRYDGIVAACGLAGGPQLATFVHPFILRDVRLQGVDSVMAPMAKRIRAWNDLAALIDLERLRQVYRVEPLRNVLDLAGQILAGRVQGRTVIDVAA